MNKVIILFDVDGTLTTSGSIINNAMLDIIKKIKLEKKNIDLGLVGGGTYNKIKYQMADNLDLFKYIFCECGSVIYINNEFYQENNLLNVVDRDYLNDIIKLCLINIAEMPILYSGHNIEFRKGLIYISPVGMQASNIERDLFMQKDKDLNLRFNLIKKIKEKDFKNVLEVVLGGEVGIAMYPKGWNKSQVMKYLVYEKIFFFGDKTDPDGNDYPLYSHPKVKGIFVKNYKDTIIKLKKLIDKIEMIK